MIYQEVDLPQGARSAALCAWRVSLEPHDPPAFEHSVPPDGTTNFLVGTGPHGQLLPLLVGPTISARIVPMSTGWSYAGLRLRPYAAEALTGVKPAAIVGRSAMSFPRRDQTAPLFAALAGLARCDDGWLTEEVVACLAGYAPADPPTANAVDRLIRTSGREKIGELVADSSLSARQFRRRFGAAAGLPPKQFASVQRVRGALILSLRQPGWAHVAQQAGYSDQPHLSRAISTTFGTSPRIVAGYIGTIRHEFLDLADDRFVQDDPAACR